MKIPLVGRMLGSLGLKAKLMLTLIPPVVVILLASGYMSYLVSSNFITIALERNARIQNLGLAHEISTYLASCRRDLLFAAGSETTPEWMADYLNKLKLSGGNSYCEFARIPLGGGEPVFLVARGGEVKRITGDLGSVRPNPMLYLDTTSSLKQGEVWPSPIMEVEYPFPSPDNPANRISMRIIRFVTPYRDEGSHGYLMLSVDARAVRNLLSLHNSPRSPMWGFPRSEELRYNYMFDIEGWILFQSENVDDPETELSSYLVREGFSGTLGRPGLPAAFRPKAGFTTFWDMVEEVGRGQQGLISAIDPEHPGEVKNYYVAFAPVKFAASPDAEPIVYAGVAFVDRSQLTLTAGYQYVDAMFVLTILSILLISLIIFFMSRLITNPIVKLSKAVRDLGGTDLTPISLPESGQEMQHLMAAINEMISKVRQQIDIIRQKDETIHNAELRERAPLEEEIDFLTRGNPYNPIPEIVGFGPRIDELKNDILKAAQVDVDVLILGATGTGKQLAAEAVHNHSSRSGRPFIALNCGALDENLLLDALFGHVKGAFTEAKADRKGAFSEAQGGTLFLDEIQSASPKVQQSLLRALAARKIKPLGSDREIDIDVRVIAASNADLSDLIADGSFREDLYFRLKVVSLRTPPLREHKESIPFLALHYLKQAELLVSRESLGLSKGAIKKMYDYDWPGNIRELVNIITRAAVMAEGDVVQAEDIRLEGEAGIYAPDSGTAAAATATVPEDHARPAEMPSPASGEAEAPARETAAPSGKAAEPAKPAPAASPPPAPAAARKPPRETERGSAPKPPLSPRQEKAWPAILAEGAITRQGYQEAVGGDLPARTALYDLQDMVKKGLLKKEGQGPATRYLLLPPGTRG